MRRTFLSTLTSKCLNDLRDPSKKARSISEAISQSEFEFDKLESYTLLSICVDEGPAKKEWRAVLLFVCLAQFLDQPRRSGGWSYCYSLSAKVLIEIQ